jgi:hypothetical protein
MRTAAYEEVNESFRLGYIEPGNHQLRFEEEYRLCVDDVMQHDENED